MTSLIERRYLAVPSAGYFCPTPRKCKISREYDYLTDRPTKPRHDILYISGNLSRLDVSG